MRLARKGMGLILLGISSLAVRAEEAETGPAPVQTLAPIEVIGTTPLHGVGLPKTQIPANVQTANSDDIERSQSLDLTDYMNRNLGSVNINAAQNNPLQPDVQYRGYTASPLLGVPQGLAVYQNGVRINEPFGDTLNWDLIPESAIGSVNLIPGSNPLFGLNTLGGALSVQMKNGFTHPGHQAELYGGSFGRVIQAVESGWNNGTFGYFFTSQYFREDGWRDFSESSTLNFWGTLSWHTKTTTVDLSVAHGDTELRGNGPLPIELLRQDRSAVFTHPDITQNNMQMVVLEGTHWFSKDIQFAANAYYRDNGTRAFNGDATPFEECAAGTDGEAVLCEEDSGEPVTDQNGRLVSEDFNAINNLSRRTQRSFGATVQSTFLQKLFGRDNQFIVGGGWNRGLTEFRSQVELSALDDTRGTIRTGLFFPDDANGIDTRTRSWSLFFTDTYSMTEKLALTVSGRYNNTHIVLRDGIGNNPELNGDHRFQRFNPGGGVTYQFHKAIGLYGSYSESARAPTPVELSCADPNAPCNLPNAFLADPPLEQVVAKTIEGGLRGELDASVLPPFLGKRLSWNIGAFHTVNEDDILFQTTGGTTGNRGFFANVGDTLRQGVEFGLRGKVEKVDWYLNYTFVDATFEKDFRISNPNHPLAEDFDGDGEGDGLTVKKGDRIPGIPQHLLKLGADWAATKQFKVGADLVFNSGQFLRGDEANRLGQTDAYAIVNLRGEYRIAKQFGIYARIDNLFDTDYETFGIVGNPGEVFGDQFNDRRFLGPGAPRAGWVGLRFEL
jgi:outer membrane receptor protein involved in Fe transport